MNEIDKLIKYLSKYKIRQNTKAKPITHTSMKGGKWHIPHIDIDNFYD